MKHLHSMFRALAELNGKAEEQEMHLFIYILIKTTVFPPQHVSIIHHKWKFSALKAVTSELCENNSSSVSSVFCRHPLVSKSCFSPISASKQQYWRDTIKALQGLKESTEKNRFSLRMNCLGGGGHSCCCPDTKCKLIIKSDDSQKKDKEKKSLGKKRCCTFNYTIKIFRCFFWTEGWRSK